MRSSADTAQIQGVAVGPLARVLVVDAPRGGDGERGDRMSACLNCREFFPGRSPQARLMTRAARVR